ncbi:MAG: arylamine N-acetyltransferase family protein [Bacillota bacterium]
MDIKAYLKRINYQGETRKDADTLKKLHVAHLMSVPFENLSIRLKEPVVLNDEALFQKIVVRNRGGFCYELNGLFAALLRELGFDVTMLSAGVAKPGGGFKADFDHMVLRVNLEEEWLADVGFGDSFVEPLVLKKDIEQDQYGRTYCIEAAGDSLIMKQCGEDGIWKPRFRFDLEPHEYREYENMCLFHQTSPESHFTQEFICSLARPDGRTTLTEKKLIITENGVKQEREVKDKEEYYELLNEYFGIKL